jgi:hypothetical protein
VVDWPRVSGDELNLFALELDAPRVIHIDPYTQRRELWNEILPLHKEHPSQPKEEL